MNKTQQSACYGILLSFVLVGLVVFDLIDTLVGLPVKLLVALVWGSLLLGPVYFIERKEYPHRVDIDERDKRTIKRALLTSIAALTGMSGVVFVIALFVLGIKRSISVTMDELSAVIYFTLITFILVLSFTVLIQYRRRTKGEEL
ncbi:MAG: hypothetical protein P8Z79_10360 [Sedimentisphaerales bacterium]|jgi:hypothetical protein